MVQKNRQRFLIVAVLIFISILILSKISSETASSIITEPLKLLIETNKEICENYCYDLDENKNLFRDYGSKTAYAKRKDTDFYKQVKIESEIHF